ncbi:MAG: hypothetical protein HN742_32355 [Lentisphaerae bacterium]|jgi:hypothetical protein|nr:hypothetical protein [Lentisphaerota bacterium]MBT5611118.1 hypothetical protein [Lentisphaerota bacterium]MBT7062250.1 hypothetical protein [Lentisphaerota bacterium]MBT7846607.1 hypothetical protein [Lentisphaerota bacterium]
MHSRWICAALLLPLALSAQLLRNRDFSQGLEAWQSGKGEGDTVDVVTEAGRSAVRIHKVTATKGYSGAHIQQQVSLTPRALYELSCRFRTKLDPGSVGWAVRAFVVGHEGKGTQDHRLMGQSGEWKPFSWRFATGNADSATVSFRLTYSSGELWIADTRLRQIGANIEAESLAGQGGEVVEDGSFSGGKGLVLQSGQAITLTFSSDPGPREIELFGRTESDGGLQLGACSVSFKGRTTTVDVQQAGTSFQGRHAYIEVPNDGSHAFSITAREGAPVVLDRIGWADTGCIATLKPLTLDTPLAVEGRPVADIVVSGEPAMRRLAEELQQNLAEHTGLRLPIVNDEKWVTVGDRSRHAIAIGNLLQNKVTERLYCLWYTREDAGYPGKGGWVVRTVHNPWATGTNAVVLAGSDAVGTEHAVGAFLRILDDLPGTTVPHTVTVALGEAMKTHFSKPNPSATRKRLPRYSQRSLMSGSADLGMRYVYTGNPDWGEDLLVRLREHRRRGNPGHDTHMELWKTLRGWDNIEESPALTEEVRLEVTNYLLQVLRGKEGVFSGMFQSSLSYEAVRHNHEMLAAMDAYYGWLYFGRYYDLPDADDWLAKARYCFGAQEQHFKGKDESGNYEATAALWPLLSYAIAEPGYTFLPSGVGRTFIDRCVITLDNRFSLSGHGDCWDTDCFAPLTFAIGAWYYRDSGYQYVLEEHYRLRPERSLVFRTYPTFAMHGVLQPERPARFEGVTVAPLDPGHYAYYREHQDELLWNTPVTNTFDKLSLRTRFEPDAQYLLLDGIACGSHGHADPNCIARFTDNGRVWIVDDCYTEGPFLDAQNGIQVTRNGLGAPLPACARLDGKADFSHAGLTRTTLVDHAGTDWERNILWLKEGPVLILDRLTAREDATFGIRLRWRTLGTVEHSGNCLTTRQAKMESAPAQHMDLSWNSDLVSSVELADERYSARWGKYPYAEPQVNVLTLDRSCDLRRGEDTVLASLIVTGDSKEGMQSKLKELPGNRFLLTEGTPTVGGLAQTPFVAGELTVIGHTFILTRDKLSVLQPTMVGIGGTVVLDGAVAALNLDAKAGQLELICSKEETATILGGVRTLEPGRTVIRFDHGAVQLAGAIAAAMAQAGVPGRGKQPDQTGFRPILTPSHRLSFDGAIAALATDAGLIAVGTQSGATALLTVTGHVMSRGSLGSPISAAGVGDLDGNGSAEAVFGTVDGHVIATDADGAQRWQFQCPVFPTRRGYLGQVHDLLVADLDGDGKAEVTVGAKNSRVLILNGDGTERREILVDGETTIHGNFAAMDVDGDGIKEVSSYAPVCSFGFVFDFRLKGAYIKSSTDGWPSHVRDRVIVDLDGNGKDEVALATNRGTLYARQWVDGRLKQVHIGTVGTGVTAMAPIHRDGEPDGFVAGLEMSYLHAFTGTGEYCWGMPTAGPVTDLVTVGTGEAIHIFATTRAGTLERFTTHGQAAGGMQTPAPVSHLRIAGTTVVAGCEDGTVLLIEQP